MSQLRADTCFPEQWAQGPLGHPSPAPSLPGPPALSTTPKGPNQGQDASAPLPPLCLQLGAVTGTGHVSLDPRCSRLPPAPVVRGTALCCPTAKGTVAPPGTSYSLARAPAGPALGARTSPQAGRVMPPLSARGWGWRWDAGTRPAGGRLQEAAKSGLYCMEAGAAIGGAGSRPRCWGHVSHRCLEPQAGSTGESGTCRPGSCTGSLSELP